MRQTLIGMQVHKQIIETLENDQKAREKIDQVEHGEVTFQVQDSQVIRWKAGTGGNVKKKTKRD